LIRLNESPSHELVTTLRTLVIQFINYNIMYNVVVYNFVFILYIYVSCRKKHVIDLPRILRARPMRARSTVYLHILYAHRYIILILYERWVAVYVCTYILNLYIYIYAYVRIAYYNTTTNRKSLCIRSKVWYTIRTVYGREKKIRPFHTLKSFCRLNLISAYTRYSKYVVQ